MMAEAGEPMHGLEHCIEVLESVSSHPEQLLSVQDGLATDFSCLTKVLYDLQKSRLALEVGSPLENLIIENFDEEQIWQQLELQNNAVLKYFKKAIQTAQKDKDIYLVQSIEEESTEEETPELEDEVEEGLSEEESEFVSENEDEPTTREKKLTDAKRPKRIPVETFSDDNDSDMDFDIDKLEKQNKQMLNKKPIAKSSEKSALDDKFFKLSEMEAFLEKVEKEDGEEDDHNEIDYFEDVDSDDEEEEDYDMDEDLDITKSKTQAKKSSRDLQYQDFFDPVEGEEGYDRDPSAKNEEENDEEDEDVLEEDEGDDLGEDEENMSEIDEEEDEQIEENEESQKAKEAFKRVTFDLSDESEGEDVGDILGGKKQEISEPGEVKSSFEKREEKMTEKIQALQKQMLEEKPWQLTGEITAQKRPENSLLSETLVFDHASRMAPVISEETTMQLEDIIKQRIKDQLWDDVVRKEKPKENAFEYKKRLTLDHDKSKLSLAEIYEQEYIKQNEKKKEEEENPKHVEIQKMMNSLFLKLDALSNFHFIPKPPVPDIKVVSNLPAISMEEVAPVNVSDATLLAPEEIKEKNKAGDVKTNAEKTITDKKRERRKKKATKRIKIKEREERKKQADKIKAEKGKKKYNKANAAADLKKLTKEGKATVLKDEGKDKALKSSQAFFSQLQDQVKLQIKGAKSAQKKQKKENELSVHKLKL